MLVSDILSPGLKTISADATMAEANKLMMKLHIRHFVVFRENKIAGILSDRDFMRVSSAFNPADKSDLHIHSFRKVSEFMFSPVFMKKHSSNLSLLIREMLDRKISSIVITGDNSNAIGIITTQDLLLVLSNKLNSPMHYIRNWLRE